MIPHVTWPQNQSIHIKKGNHSKDDSHSKQESTANSQMTHIPNRKVQLSQMTHIQTGKYSLLSQITRIQKRKVQFTVSDDSHSKQESTAYCLPGTTSRQSVQNAQNFSGSKTLKEVIKSNPLVAVLCLFS